jgi:hypothetical protein
MPSLFPKLKFGVLAALILPLCVLAPGCAAPTSEDHGPTVEKQIEFRQVMRKLWEDHITWTRLVIVSTSADLPDLNVTTQRLLQNQTDIGNAIKPFYGDSAGIKLTGLLREHIIGAASILAAAKANDQAKLETAKTAWYANADEIAAFLSGADPGAWKPAETRAMMKEHLDLTLAEAVDQLQKRYLESVADYDKVHGAILKMADILSSGIIRQFPKLF